MKPLALICAFISVIFFTGCVNDTGAQTGHEHHQHAAAHHEEAPELSGGIENGIRVVGLEAFKYGFSPDPVVVKAGEKVRINLTSTDVTHGVGIKDFGVNITARAGETGSAEFTPEKAGTFHMHCSVYCGPEHGNMHGTLIVVE